MIAGGDGSRKENILIRILFRPQSTHNRAHTPRRFSIQGDELQEYEQLTSCGVANIHKCKRSILRRLKCELQYHHAIYQLE
jgi:hypothetical protein